MIQGDIVTELGSTWADYEIHLGSPNKVHLHAQATPTGYFRCLIPFIRGRLVQIVRINGASPPPGGITLIVTDVDSGQSDTYSGFPANEAAVANTEQAEGILLLNGPMRLELRNMGDGNQVNMVLSVMDQ